MPKCETNSVNYCLQSIDNYIKYPKQLFTINFVFAFALTFKKPLHAMICKVCTVSAHV